MSRPQLPRRGSFGPSWAMERYALFPKHCHGVQGQQVKQRGRKLAWFSLPLLRISFHGLELQTKHGQRGSPAWMG